jgi:hypothetical protein
LPVLDIVSKKHLSTDLSSERDRKTLNVLIFYLEQEIIEARKELYKDQDQEIQEAQIEIPPK